MGKKSVANGAATGVKSRTARQNGPERISLPDGTQVPVAMPPGVDPALYQQALAYLRANPGTAQQTAEQVHRVLENPEMARHYMLSQQQLQDPDNKKKLEALKDDPELAAVFEDIKNCGAAAMERYWNDTDLMTKISQKMGALGVGTQPSKAAKHIPVKPETLHDAAKLGDTEAAEALIAEGAEVNTKDKRGITPLGVAVGFNKLPVIKVLLAAGADVSLTDNRGNTPLHYAAGYGRKDAAELLLGAGAEVEALNNDQQSPADAAKVNREMHMVTYLNQKAGKKPVSEKEIFL